MYKISIIIPIYNAEKYLRDVLDSIVNQTMELNEIQVIMVDDFSTDSSREIMNEYSNKYKNFISLMLPENHVVAGTARNEGMKIAEGKYLMFADADDTYSKEACEILYNEIEKRNADFITANYINMDYDGQIWDKPIFDTKKYKDFKLSIDNHDNSFFVLNSAVWNKIFRKSFVEKEQITFLEEVMAEDAFFTTACFMKAKNVYYTSKVIYNYRQRNQGNRKSKSVSFDCSRDYFSRINYSYKQIYENFKNNKQLSFYRYTYAKNMSYLLYKFIDSTVLKHNERINVLKDMKWFYNLTNELKVEPAQKCQSMIINKILKDDYEEAIKYCEIIADVRKNLPKEVKENMSKPDSKMYKKISKYDNEFVDL